MHRHAHFSGRPIAIACVFLAAIALVACEQSKQQAPAPAKASLAMAATEKVYVVFEGPWAIVEDPKDANSILAVAPKTKSHNDLYVAASNESTLAPGTYNLSVPPHGPATSAPLGPSFAQAKINAQSLQHALDDKSRRYVIRLPKPEAYAAARRFLSRVGPSYPPDPSTEQNYVTFVSILYSVGSLNGFSVSGTPDTGTFNPLLLQLDTPTIRIAIEQPDTVPDPCHNHSRGAFRDTVKFLGLKLYVDFPNDSPDCHKTDPQITGSTTTEANPMSPLERAMAFLNGDLIEVQTANTAGAAVPRDLMSMLFFFHSTDGSCRAPILFLTSTP